MEEASYNNNNNNIISFDNILSWTNETYNNHINQKENNNNNTYFLFNGIHHNEHQTAHHYHHHNSSNAGHHNDSLATAIIAATTDASTAAHLTSTLADSIIRQYIDQVTNAASIKNVTTGIAGGNTIFGIKSQYTPLEAILTGVLLLTIIVVTIIGNILVCLAVFLVKKLRRPCNYLLVSLAVSDLCVAILVMPMAMLYEILGRWNFGNFMCDVWVSFDVLSCTASILNLCMISVDRYFAITKPLEYGVKRTPKRMIVCVSLVWLGAACISLPPLLILGNEHDIIDGVKHCVVCQNFAYQIYATLGSFYIPLTVMIVVYYKIFCAARRIVLEERKAQSHLETNHCFLEISVKNGGGPPESRLTTNVVVSYDSSPAIGNVTTSYGGTRTSSQHQHHLQHQHHHHHHRTSTTSTTTTCSVGGNINYNNNNNNNNNSSDNGGLYGSGRCFSGGSRPSNESQYPMLQSSSACKASSRGGTIKGAGIAGKFKAKAKKNSTSSGIVGRLGVRTSGVTLASNSSTVSHTKKLRFQLAKERKASTTLGIIMSAFTVCWLPFFVLALVRPFLKNSKTIPSSLSSFFLWLGYANSLLNPIIYATLNRDFRRPFQQILFFRCGSLNHMMREEFYHSQYGDPDPPQHFYVSGNSPERVMVQNLQIRDNDSTESAVDTPPTVVKSSFPISTCVANESFL